MITIDTPNETNMKLSKKSIIGNRNLIFIIGAILFWILIIILKQGGQSLVIHYAWPFIVGGTFLLLFDRSWIKNKPGISELLMLLALSIFLITFIFNLSPSNGSLELMNISGGLLLVLTIHQAKWTEDDLMKLFLGIIAVVVLLDIWGIFMYAGGHPFDRLIGPLVKPNKSFAGFPNLLANLNILAIIPAVYLHHIAKTKKQTAYMCITCFVLFTGFLLTFSRAAWLSAIFGIVIVAITTFKFNRKSLRVILAFLISLILVSGINTIRSNSQHIQSLEEKLIFQSEDESSSITERIASMQRGWNMAISHPLTGVGSGSFNYISQSYEKNFKTLSSYPYSLPVKIIAENGILFFSLLLLWLAIVLITSFSNKSQIFVIASITILSLLIHHSIDNNFDFFATSFPFFILIGIIWPRKKTRKKAVINNKWILTIILIATLAGMVFAIHEAWYGRYYIQGRNLAGVNNHKEAFEAYGKANRLFFPRDASLAQSYSAFEVYKKNKDSVWLINSINKAKEYLEFNNPLDSQGALQLTTLAYEQKNYSNCLNYVQKAKILGGENNFESDYYEFICLYNKGDTEILNNFIIQIKPVLNKYLELLKVNAHMTILTDNPRYAIYLLEELLKDGYSQFNLLYKDMLKTARSEYKKFHARYGIKAEIDFLN
ncbi:O-antigen ligase family protein [bacterium]|nr:O-antigen ligase family protein [bacterium]